jgi:hypothetical protein
MPLLPNKQAFVFRRSRLATTMVSSGCLEQAIPLSTGATVSRFRQIAQQGSQLLEPRFRHAILDTIFCDVVILAQPFVGYPSRRRQHHQDTVAILGIHCPHHQAVGDHAVDHLGQRRWLTPGAALAAAFSG